MALVLYSNQELSVLEEMAKSLFLKVPSKNLAKISYSKAPLAFLPDQLCKVFKIKTNQKSRKLIIKFVLPSYYKEFRSKPLSIISHLVGHEGEGSLLSCLMSKGLVLELVAYKYNYNDYFTVFPIICTLTEKGQKNYLQILDIVFSYLALLKRSKVPKYVFDEVQTINKINFEFQNKKGSLNKAMEVAVALNEYSPQIINKLSSLYEEFVPDKYAKALDQMTPQNMLLEFRSHEFDDLPLVEPIYQVSYSVESIPSDLVTRLEQILTDFGSLTIS